MKKTFTNLLLCFLFLLFVGGCGTDEDSIVGKYTAENTPAMEIEFTEDGKCVTTFSGTYTLGADGEDPVLSIIQADTSGAGKYQIVQQEDLLELRQNGETVLSLKHQSGKNGLAEDPAGAFEGSYCYASDEANEYRFYEDGTLEMINTQTYQLTDSGGVELQGSEGSVSYLLERTEDGLCFQTEDGRTVLELVRK